MQWESQASTAADSLKGRRIRGLIETPRTFHLFLQYEAHREVHVPRTGQVREPRKREADAGAVRAGDGVAGGVVAELGVRGHGGMRSDGRRSASLLPCGVKGWRLPPA